MNLSLALSQARPGAQWSLNGNTLDGLTWIGPGNPPTLEELEAAWVQLEAHKIWTTVSDFWAEFSDPEKLDISDSTIPDIRLLHEELRMWRGEVWSDDTKVQKGLVGLVTVGILTESRKTEILTKK
jgi:hypothetical protein